MQRGQTHTMSSLHSSQGDEEELPSNNHRRLDDYLEAAYHSSTQSLAWEYWAIMLSLGVANCSDASEILCLSYILSDETFEEKILLNTAWRGGVLASAVFLGMLLGGLLIGTLGDYVGRRPILLLGLFCNTTAGVLSAVATNVWILSILRCIAGVGIGATVPPLFTLVAELAPPSRRGFFVTLCASFWMIGSIFVAVTALYLFQYMNTSWRIFAVACALPSALGCLLVHHLVPESPRFLATSGRQREALEEVNRLASQMSYRGPPLTFTEITEQFPSGSSSRRFVMPRSFSVASLVWVAKEAVTDFLSSASKLYAPEMKQVTWPLQMVWFSLCFGSYGLLTWINTIFKEVHLENVYFNALLFALSNLPGNMASAYFMDRSGRTPLLVGSILAAAVSLLSFAWFASGSTINAFGVVLSACLFQCFTITAWNTIDCMTSELFPTKVRATGMGVCAASGRIGAMIAQFVNGALAASPVRLVLVASMTLLLGATTPFWLSSGDMTGQPVADDVSTTLRMQGSPVANYSYLESSSTEPPSAEDDRQR
jgi:MFS family permease